MKKKLISAISSTSMILMLLLSGCSSDTTNANASNTETTPSEETSTTTPDESESVTETEPATEPVEPVTITVTAIGDMLMHAGASIPALQADGSYNYDYLFTNVKDKIQAADLAVVNQEVIFGGNEKGLLGYPLFNIRTEQGTALVNAGFDVVLCATNHSIDQHAAGTLNTIKFWKTTHPDTTYLGIHESQEEADTITVKDINGIKVAMLNYTYGLNGFNLPEDKPYLIDLMNQYTKDKVVSDIAKAKEISDFVIVFPHWGTEYVFKETVEQQEWAQLFADNGVDLVIGTHPHVIEPVKWIEGKDGNRTLVYYSLGNFVSIQYYNYNMLGGMANVSITKDATGTYVSDYDMDFLVTHYTPGRTVVTTYFLDDYTNELAAQHAILTEPGEKYMKVNANYPFTVEGLKNLAEQVCPDLADY